MTSAALSDPGEQEPIVLDERDLSAAVDAKVISEDQSRALVALAKTRRALPSPSVDEEDVRLVTSFNDVFVTLGIALSVGSLIGLGASLAPLLTAPAVAALAWGLSEIFTRRRHMAFPSIVLTALFTGAVAVSVMAPFGDHLGAALPLVGGGAAFLGAFFHWRRFRVPIGMAAMTAGAAAAAIGAVMLVLPDVLQAHTGIVFLVAGVAVFLFAMRWDTSDRQRRTRRSDTAFWLHVLAAPLIVHPLAGLAGVDHDVVVQSSPWPALVLFAVLAAVALIVDRRALLVSGLIYFGGSILALIQQAGWSSSTVGAATAGVVGAAVLLLSIAWTPLRDRLLPFVPASLRVHMPAARVVRGFPK
jgi:hypothetical protein